MEPDVVDCRVPLTESVITCLVSNGIKYVGRHYTGDHTSLTLAEAQLISAAGLQIIAIYDSGFTNLTYGAEGGSGDWSAASTQAAAAQQPAGSLIYFNCPSNIFDDLSKYTGTVQVYLQGLVGSTDQNYVMGAYGSSLACNFCVVQQSAFGAWITSDNSANQVSYYVRQQASGVSLCGITCNTAKIVGSAPKSGNGTVIGSFTVPAT